MQFNISQLSSTDNSTSLFHACFYVGNAANSTERMQSQTIYIMLAMITETQGFQDPVPTNANTFKAIFGFQ